MSFDLEFPDDEVPILGFRRSGRQTPANDGSPTSPRKQTLAILQKNAKWAQGRHSGPVRLAAASNQRMSGFRFIQLI